MPLRSEWIAGVTASGRRLPAAKVTAYRTAAGLDPLPVMVSHAVKPEPRTPPPCRLGKTGDELAALLKSLGINPGWCTTGCHNFAKQMNQWGVEGCRARRAEIVQRLEEQQRAAGWSVTAKAAAMAMVNGIAFRIDLADPLGWLVDEAIRLAEAAEKCSDGTCAS